MLNAPANGQLGPPVAPFYLFFGKGSPTKIDSIKSWHPYSNLSKLEDLGNDARFVATGSASPELSGAFSALRTRQFPSEPRCKLQSRNSKTLDRAP